MNNKHIIAVSLSITLLFFMILSQSYHSDCISWWWKPLAIKRSRTADLVSKMDSIWGIV